jgi:hypothetical protein
MAFDNCGHAQYHRLMRNTLEPVPLDPAREAKSRSGLVALLLCAGGAVTLALLIPFGTLSSCSRARIAAFLVLLGASAALILTGTIAAGLSYRRTKDRRALIGLAFTAIYAILLLYLIGLIS